MMYRMGEAPMFCITCKKVTSFAREFHSSGDYLFRCARCGTWTLAEPSIGERFARVVRKNPIRDEVRKAVKLARDFSGHAPTKIRRVKALPRSNVRVAVGTVTGIMYLARRDGKIEQYLHRFGRGFRPSLTVSPDGKHLQLLGGAFRFTERGIVDARKP